MARPRKNPEPVHETDMRKVKELADRMYMEILEPRDEGDMSGMCYAEKVGYVNRCLEELVMEINLY